MRRKSEVYQNYNRKKQAAAAVCVLTAGLCLAQIHALPARGQQTQPAQTAAPYLTCIIPSKTGLVYWEEVEEGIRSQAQEEGFDLDVIYTENRTESLAIGINDAIDIGMLNGSDAIILSYNDAVEETDRKLRQAREQGIKVVLIDCDAQPDLRDCYVGIANKEAGYALASYARENLEEGRRVLVPVLSNYLVKQNLIDRLSGVQEAFSDDPDRLVLYTIEEGSRIEQAQALRTAFSENPDIGAVIGCSESVVNEAAQVLGTDLEQQKIRLYGFDRTQETQQMLQDGLIQAFVSQNSSRMGEESVEAAARLLRGEQQEDTQLVTFELIEQAQPVTAKKEG